MKNNNSAKINFLSADDFKLFRAVIRLYLEQEQDIRMPGMDGLEAAKQIASLAISTRAILISIYRGSFVLKQAQAAGAKSFVPKDDLATSLLAAVDAVHRGERSFVE